MLRKNRRTMIGAWCRSTGWLLAVEHTPEAIAKAVGVKVKTVLMFLDGKTPTTSKYTVIIKRIAA